MNNYSTRYRRPKHCAAMDWDNSLFLMRIPLGVPIELNDSAAMIWLAAVDGEDPVTSIAEAAGMHPDDVFEQVLTVLDQLIAAGVLERVN